MRQVIGLCLLLGLLGCSSSDGYIRDRVVKLQSERGSCSGIKVMSENKHYFILTAAHCSILANDKQEIKVIDEDGRQHQEKIIEEDGSSDLLLLTSDSKEGIKIADRYYSGEHVRAITHGHGYKSYKTEGELIREHRATVAIKEITDDKSKQECESKQKNKVIETFIGPLCVLDVTEAITTAKVVPGMSGGGVVDDDGKLVGIVSATDGDFGMLVKLGDISAFMLGR